MVVLLPVLQSICIYVVASGTSMEGLFNWAQMIADPCFLPVELELVKNFRLRCQERLNIETVAAKSVTFSHIMKELNLNEVDFPKDGHTMDGFWLAYLTTMAPLLPQSCIKYKTQLEFTEAYMSKGYFGDARPEELFNLWHIANWMSVLFTLIPAKKNKGLAIQIIPKLVEGWRIKYVTGSGQTKATANRVHVFETEGGVKAHQRGKNSSKTPGHIAKLRQNPGMKKYNHIKAKMGRPRKHEDFTQLLPLSMRSVVMGSMNWVSPDDPFHLATHTRDAFRFNHERTNNTTGLTAEKDGEMGRDLMVLQDPTEISYLPVQDAFEMMDSDFINTLAPFNGNLPILTRDSSIHCISSMFKHHGSTPRLYRATSAEFKMVGDPLSASCSAASSPRTDGGGGGGGAATTLVPCLRLPSWEGNNPAHSSTSDYCFADSSNYLDGIGDMSPYMGTLSLPSPST